MHFKTLITSLFVFLFLSCNEKPKTFNKEALAFMDHVIYCNSNPSLIGSGYDTIVCPDLLKRFPADLSSISLLTQTWLCSNDSCVCELIHKISEAYLQTDSVAYLTCLDSVSMHSDGFISEELEYSLIEIIKAKKKSFFPYLKKTEFTSCLGDYLYGYVKYEFELESEEHTIEKFREHLTSYLPEVAAVNDYIEHYVKSYADKQVQ